MIRLRVPRSPAVAGRDDRSRRSRRWEERHFAHALDGRAHGYRHANRISWTLRGREERRLPDAPTIRRRSVSGPSFRTPHPVRRRRAGPALRELPARPSYRAVSGAEVGLRVDKRPSVEERRFADGAGGPLPRFAGDARYLSGFEGQGPLRAALRAAGVGQGGAPAAKRGRTTLTNPRAGADSVWAGGRRRGGALRYLGARRT